MALSEQREQELLAEVKKWKEIAEFEHAKRCWSSNLSLGQGALDAYAQKWQGFGPALKDHLEKIAKSFPQYVPSVPDWLEPKAAKRTEGGKVLVDVKELSALRLNDARYRWLRDESWAGYNISKSKPQVAETIVFVERHGMVKMVLAEEALDEAVDAALAADKKAVQV